jgi:hypothetical protein
MSVRSLRLSLPLIAPALLACGELLRLDEFTTASGDAGREPGCGDGSRGGDEQCDGEDLGGLTDCASAVAPGWIGTVACSSECLLDLGGCTTPETSYHDVTDQSRWSTFDLTEEHSAAKGFAGGVFDGEHVYLVPFTNGGAASGNVARFDAMQPDLTKSWELFDITALHATAKGFVGGAFDGRHLYLVPYNNDAGHSGEVARYDTRAPFTQSTAWEFFDLTKEVNASAKGFHGAVFDGRYLYLVPYFNDVYHGLVARYDTTSAFGSPASWSTFDVASVNAGAKGFQGATFDGRHLYLAPCYSDVLGYNGVVARLDTTAPFGAKASWSTFDVTTVSTGARGFAGAAFDGRYVYLVPLRRGQDEYHGLVTRLDTTGELTDPGAWSTFDVAAVSPNPRGFVGATFDGRYVYLVPYYDGTYHGVVAQLDTKKSFASPEAWRTFNVAALDPDAVGFNGAVFDGRHVYLVPFMRGSEPVEWHGTVARFDAKTPAWLPPGWHASFY